MKSVKVFALHPWIDNAEKLKNYICFENNDFVFLWDPVDPEYVFVSEHIYLKKRYYKKFLSLYNTERVFIYFAGECIAPDLNLFDYAVVFNRKLKCGDRVARIPAMYFHQKGNRILKNNLTTETAQEEYKKKIGFCNFLYSNGNAHPQRDRIFYKLCEYKKVDSWGAHLRNVKINGQRGAYDWGKGGINIKCKYKFSIAAENASYEGYVTEKLLTSLQAHTVPVYWGDPDVIEEFNPEAIIFCNQYHNLDEVLEIVKQVDMNEDAWIKIVSAPWQTEEQIIKQNADMEEYARFLYNIFIQQLDTAKRVGFGTYPKQYRIWYSRGFAITLPELITKVKRKLEKHV